ncbi:MAG TPA: Hpt domain-containing protein [Longimicrobiales bacterium]|nr:Hpt domain-containing protein [Longimicrobiales bacterium]
MDDVPVLDEGALQRLDEWGGAKLRRQMARLYLENARRRLDQIDDALADGDDLGGVEMAAHSLKSSAANVGLMRVSVLAARVEDAAAKTEGAELPALRERLQAAAAEGAVALNALLEAEDA